LRAIRFEEFIDGNNSPDREGSQSSSIIHLTFTQAMIFLPSHTGLGYLIRRLNSFFDGFRVKDFFVHRTARGLILPFVIVICVLLAASAPAQAGKTAFVEVGFLGDPPKDLTSGIPLFQNVFLNVASVRISTNPTASGGSGKFQIIPVPPGIAGSGGNAELQIDLNDSQNVPQFFNTASVKPGNYMVAELELDPNNPGTVVSRCPSSPPVNTADGCINYPLQLTNTTIISTPISGLSPQTGQLAPLVLQLSMTVNQAPTMPGGAYMVTIGIAPVTAMPVQGTITGNVTGAGNSKKKIRKLTVTAEPIGTGTAITTATFQNGSNCASKTQGCFTLALPAATNFGTLYDIAVAGGGNTYAAQRLLPLLPGESLPLPGDNSLNFTVTGNRPLGSITGTITDKCTGNPVVGATLELLIPPDSNPTANCFDVATVGQCVVVATANTDNAGNFPMPGMITTPSEFQNVPQNVATMTVKNPPYAMEITAPGYEPLIVQALPTASSGKNTGGTCAPIGSTTFASCNLSLMTGYIKGAISIIPPPSGQTTLVQVFAEDHDTNNIENALPMPISIKSSNVGPCLGSGAPPSDGCVNFTLNVPPSIPAGAFDLFASTIDLYQGATDPYQGHNIVAISDVPAPAACATATALTPTDSSQVIGCVGHGSIFGPVANPNLGTSVILEKLDPTGPANDNAVQITSSLVQNQPPLVPSSSSYSFCAPADTYQVQQAQLPMPDSMITPVAAPSPALVAGSEVSVTIPAPPLAGGNPTPTPAIKCPTTCSNPDGTCPGICNSKNQPIAAP
jgi:hypothetical protein